MIGPAVVADEEALVEVGPRRLVHGRGALDAFVDGQIADVVLIQLEGQLVLERHCVELGEAAKAASISARDSVVTVEEPDGLAGVLDLTATPRGHPDSEERWREVDDRDVARGLLDVLHRQGLQDVHGARVLRPES
jgi:hypothetical protein